MPQFIESSLFKHEANAEKVTCLVWLGVIAATYTLFMLGFRTTVDSSLVMNITWLVAVLGPSFGLLAWLIQRGIYNDYMKYINVFLQVTLISGAIYFDWEAQGAAYALSSMPPMAYALVPMITAFRLQPKLGLFSGTMAAVQFLLLYSVFLEPSAELIKEIPSLGRDVTAMKAVVLFALGVASALAANSLKKYFVNYGKAQETRIRLEQNFGRFVSTEIVKRLELSSDGTIPPSAQKAAIVFGDIRGFTSFSANRDSLEVTRLLNQFFAIVCKEVEKEGGMVNKFLGDGYLAFFGLYQPGSKPCEAAARAVLNIKQQSAVLLAPYNLKAGAAANYGEIITGEVGSEGRCEFTAIGAPVNLASRLEGMNDSLGTDFVVSQEFVGHLNTENFTISYKGDHAMKGLQEPVVIFSIA